MSPAGRWLSAGVVTLGAAGLLGWLSQVGYGAARAGEAMVRLAWRTRGTRVEECRRRTPAELEGLPVHMRQPEVCQGRVLPYRLVAVIDGRTVADEEIRPTGARADRPLYVFQEIAVSAGAHDISITLTRDVVPADTASQPERLGERESPAPPRLEFSGRVTLAPDQVALVTYDPDQRRLILKGYGRS